VADTAQAVKDQVADSSSDWQRRFGLEIPREACESWRLQMARLADDLIHAALKQLHRRSLASGDSSPWWGVVRAVDALPLSAVG